MHRVREDRPRDGRTAKHNEVSPPHQAPPLGARNYTLAHRRAPGCILQQNGMIDFLYWSESGLPQGMSALLPIADMCGALANVG